MFDGATKGNIYTRLAAKEEGSWDFINLWDLGCSDLSAVWALLRARGFMP